MLRHVMLLMIVLSFTTSAALSENNRFDDLFSLQGRLTLQDSQLKFISLYTARIGPSGRISLIQSLPSGRDFVGLKTFSVAGRLVRTIKPPPPDSTPTEKQERFFGFAEDEGGWMYANSMRVIFAYDSSGHLQKSYPVSAKNPQKREEAWGSSIMKIDIAPNNALVGVGVGFPIPNYLHIYDKSGKLLKECYPLDSRFAEGEALINPGLTVDSLGDVWCTHSAFYKVFHFGVDGTHRKDIMGKSSVFIPPDLSKSPNSLKKWYQWLKTWTPVVECAATKSGYVILSMLAGQKGKPLMKNYDSEPMAIYGGGIFLDIYNREGNLIAGGLHTPHRFLCVDDKDNLWFVLAPQTPENPAKDGLVILGKYKLNLKPVVAEDEAAKAGK